MKKIRITSPGTLLSVGLLAAVSGCLTAGYTLTNVVHTDTTAPTISQTTRTVTDSTNLLGGQWQYLPGANVHRDHLDIQPLGLAIVNQDGSGGQPNPPINLYGTHLENATDFSVSAVMSNRQGQATMQLYGQTPIIADEFRVERKSVKLSLDAAQLQVSIWDGSGQQPVVTKTYPLAAPSQATITLRQQGGNLTFLEGATILGTVPSGGIFDSHSVWFGFDGTAPWTLSGLTAMGLGNSPVTIADSSSLQVSHNADNGLQSLASHRRNGLTLGAAVALGPAVSDPDYQKVLFGGNFGAITTENVLKWQFVEPQPGIYNFQEGDALVAMAAKHDMVVHGHTLVFGEANPHWVTSLPVVTTADKQKVRQVMLDHITTVVGHYRGKMASWDVVNEPLADYDTFDSSTGAIFRNDIWYRAMGERFIADAFRTAHSADPHAKLFINEYGLEEDGDRWDAFLGLIKKLKSEAVPIDGVGFQAHVYDASDKIDPTVLAQHMQTLAGLGLVSRVSENDVYSDDGTAIQAQQYANVLSACLRVSSCIDYTTWGVSNRYDVFKDDNGSITYGQDLLWDSNMQPTPAVTALQQLLQK